MFSDEELDAPLSRPAAEEIAVDEVKLGAEGKPFMEDVETAESVEDPSEKSEGGASAPDVEASLSVKAAQRKVKARQEEVDSALAAATNVHAGTYWDIADPNQKRFCFSVFTLLLEDST